MRLSDRLIQEREFVEKSIGMDTTICSKCDATLRNMSEKCSADLSEACPGFMAIERMKGKFVGMPR